MMAFDPEAFRMRDEQLGISIRLIRQWRPPSPEEDAAAWIALARSVWQLRYLTRWHAELTAADRAWLLELGISPR